MYSRKPFGCNCFPGLLFGWLVSGAPTHQLAPLITSSRKSSYLCSIKPQTTDVSHSGASSVIIALTRLLRQAVLNPFFYAF